MAWVSDSACLDGEFLMAKPEPSRGILRPWVRRDQAGVERMPSDIRQDDTRL